MGSLWIEDSRICVQPLLQTSHGTESETLTILTLSEAVLGSLALSKFQLKRLLIRKLFLMRLFTCSQSCSVVFNLLA